MSDDMELVCSLNEQFSGCVDGLPSGIGTHLGWSRL